MTSIGWEYAVLLVERDPKHDWQMSGTIYFPDRMESLDVGEGGALAHLNELGRSGWEVLGAPDSQNVVVWVATGDKPGQGVDRAYWVERRFWLKRATHP